MDRLEEIKGKTIWTKLGYSADIKEHLIIKEDIDWLISEIERLRKEREWLLEDIHNLTGEWSEDIEKDMQQALEK